ncbi:MAG: outer membrane beta-barrel protein [Gammaproteobacteria bacterium]
MRKQSSWTIGLLLAAGLMSATAMAGGDTGIYVGAGVGQASIGDIDLGSDGSYPFDGDDTGYKVIAGYNFGVIPLIDLGAELNYIDFGKPHDNGVNIKADGVAAYGLAGVNLGPAGLFAKAGFIRWDAKASSVAGSGSDDGTDPAYGIGARIQLFSIQVRAEYEAFDLDGADDVDLLSLSALYTF